MKSILIVAVCLFVLVKVSHAATGIKVGPITHGNVSRLNNVIATR